MKKSLLHSLRIEKQLLLGLLVLSSFLSNAQNLIFDNTFNGNNYHIDNYDPFSNSYPQPGHMKQLNDSTFLYYDNKIDYVSNVVDTRIVSKTIKSDGSIQDYSFVANSYPIGINNIEVGDYDITDIVTNGTNIYVLRNELYDDNGTFRYKIRVFGYDENFNSISTFGGGAIFVTQSNTTLRNAKGTMMGDSLVIAYMYNNGGPSQVGCSVIAPTGLYSVQLASNNSSNLFSGVQDVVAVNINEIYIADNAALYTNTGGNITYTDVSRVIKWDAENNAFSPDYTGNGTGKSVSMPWNSQSETPFVQDFISKMLLENDKIIVAGYTREYDGSPYSMTKGRITRLNTNGSLDNTFANNGTFNQNFTSSYVRWQFNDIDISPLGTFYLSGNGNVTSPTDPSQSFVLNMDNTGVVNTIYGNNGFLYESSNAVSIASTCIVPGNTELDNRFVIYGSNMDGNRFLGRLVWSNGGTSNLSDLNQSDFSIYPNPAQDVLNIELETPSSIVVTDINGKQLMTSESSVTHQMNLEPLEAGVYFIQIENGATQKFIKN